MKGKSAGRPKALLQASNVNMVRQRFIITYMVRIDTEVWLKSTCPHDIRYQLYNSSGGTKMLLKPLEIRCEGTVQSRQQVSRVQSHSEDSTSDVGSHKHDDT